MCLNASFLEVVRVSVCSLLEYPFSIICFNFLPLQQQIQSTQMKELEEQLTTVQHEVKQHHLRLQELEEQLKGSQELGAGLQQQVDEYCSSVDKLEEELADRNIKLLFKR